MRRLRPGAGVMTPRKVRAMLPMPPAAVDKLSAKERAEVEAIVAAALEGHTAFVTALVQSGLADALGASKAPGRRVGTATRRQGGK